MFKLTKLIFIVFILFLSSSAYSSSWETINDLKQSISMLQEKQKEIYSKNPDLSCIEDIKSFLKADLTQIQVNEINNIIWEYNAFKIQNKNVDNYQSLLLSIKKETYKKLTVYVNEDKLSNYLEYIKNNLETVKKDIDIKSEITKKQEILEAKVDAIKEKIKENKDEIESSLIDIINIKIEEKLNIIKEHKDFQKLNLENKKYVIEQIIKKVEIKKEEKIKSWNAIKEREMYVYDALIEKLNLFLKELK